jgi:hypothetical protein
MLLFRNFLMAIEMISLARLMTMIHTPALITKTLLAFERLFISAFDLGFLEDGRLVVIVSDDADLLACFGRDGTAPEKGFNRFTHNMIFRKLDY